MDFNKINVMVDELNKNFGIIEEQTKTIKAENLEKHKEMFWEARTYFKNFYELFEKVRIDKHSKVGCYINSDKEYWVGISYGEHYGNWVISAAGFLPTISLCSCNPRWYESNIFNNGYFEEIIIPLIKRTDWAYVEKQLCDELNKAITKKAEHIEKQYNKAVNAK